MPTRSAGHWVQLRRRAYCSRSTGKSVHRRGDSAAVAQFELRGAPKEWPASVVARQTRQWHRFMDMLPSICLGSLDSEENWIESGQVERGTTAMQERPEPYLHS